MSLRARMGLAAGVAVAIAVIAVAVSAYAGTRSVLRSRVDQSLQSLARPVLQRADASNNEFNPQPGAPGGGGGPGAGESGGDPDEGLGLDRLPPQAFGGASGAYTLVTADGRTVSPSSQTYQIPADARAKATAASGHGAYFTDMNVGKHHIRVLVTGIGARGALMVALPLTDVDHALSSQLLLLALIAAGGIALAALLGILVARTALSPIARFTRQTESIATNAEWLERDRLDVVGSDELARLAHTFNTTLDTLERSIAAQRNLVADASHELRTPIASLRANLQLLRDEALLSPEDREALRADMIEELDDLTALVSDVVELARGTKSDGGEGDVRVDEIVVDAVERARRRAPEIMIETKLEPTLVRGEGDRIARAVANLLDNAAKWSPPGGLVEVELRGGTFSVRDNGPGFHEDDLPYVFDRFHRARDARSKPGSGLGLAIVRQAAEAHGGFVEARNAPGGGALLRIGFGEPLALEQQPLERISAP
jgi:two-component system, OmpR family, sensor histidine kinase MprB